jgi:hypothetical protein
MTAATIGIFSGLFTILTIAILKWLDKTTMYGLVLACIGFLYVGFTWTDTLALVITCIQAVCFLLLAYYGIKKSFSLLIAGYFLHGLWDLAYAGFYGTNLIPPHYEIFCFSIDFTMGLYLMFLKSKSFRQRK